ncbi:MAG: hypothetical protein L6Q98_04955 [Anaerolineae bacterium]|nr:hypothetical protein [Anaerolineae bacterium]NUQ05229.1 SH3 domain-containing protein [Anaerolineae bacterium]
MTIWMLLAVGAGFAGLSGLNNLLKTILRRHSVGFFDLLLIFAATLLPAGALIAAHLGDAPDPLIAHGVLLIGGGVAAAHLLIALLEIFRPQRLRGSRGILGMFSALILAFSAVYIPFVAAYFSLTLDPAPVSAAAASTAAVSEQSGGGQATADASEDEERFAEMFRAIFGFVAEETALDEMEIVDRLEAGTPLAKIITDSGGDVDRVVHQIAEVTRQVIRESAARGQINPVQAALAVSQMETFVRFLVNSDITRLADRMGGEPDPQATRPSLRALFETPQATLPAAVEARPDPTETAIATETPTALPSATPTAMPTRTPLPTREPTATRFAFATRTPTITPTPVRPCLASVEYNLRLRAAPDYDSETLLVIPFGTAVELVGRGGASENGAFWWRADYEGVDGWLDGGYMIVSRACDALPVLSP